MSQPTARAHPSPQPRPTGHSNGATHPFPGRVDFATVPAGGPPFVEAGSNGVSPFPSPFFPQTGPLPPRLFQQQPPRTHDTQRSPFQWSYPHPPTLPHFSHTTPGGFGGNIGLWRDIPPGIPPSFFGPLLPRPGMQPGGLFPQHTGRHVRPAGPSNAAPVRGATPMNRPPQPTQPTQPLPYTPNARTRGLFPPGVQEELVARRQAMTEVRRVQHNVYLRATQAHRTEMQRDRRHAKITALNAAATARGERAPRNKPGTGKRGPKPKPLMELKNKNGELKSQSIRSRSKTGHLLMYFTEVRWCALEEPGATLRKWERL